jgi:hypothetical protein
MDPMTSFEQADAEATERFYEDRDDQTTICADCPCEATEERVNQLGKAVPLCNEHAAQWDAGEPDGTEAPGQPRREKGDDDGVEYGDPRDEQDDRLFDW